jgi:hypothetical protein
MAEEFFLTCLRSSFLHSQSDIFRSLLVGLISLAHLDCLVSLSMVAKRDGFCRPLFNQNDRQILVRDGRNIIVEQVSILINFLFFNNGGGDKSLNVKCFGKEKIFWNKITNLPRWDAFQIEIFTKNICQGRKT